MTHVIACIDGSTSAPAVCDYAAWASLSLEAPLTFLHVLDQRQYPVAADLSGNIGLGSREHLLDELASLDEQRGKLALEQGRIMLAAAKERAVNDGVRAPESKQRHGDLLESLQELQSETRLLVIGRQGESSGGLSQHVGSQLESVIRIMHRPILVTPANFKAQERDAGIRWRRYNPQGCGDAGSQPAAEGAADPSGHGWARERRSVRAAGLGAESADQRRIYRSR